MFENLCLNVCVYQCEMTSCHSLRYTACFCVVPLFSPNTYMSIKNAVRPFWGQPAKTLGKLGPSSGMNHQSSLNITGAEERGGLMI